MAVKESFDQLFKNAESFNNLLLEETNEALSLLSKHDIGVEEIELIVRKSIEFKPLHDEKEENRKDLHEALIGDINDLLKTGKSTRNDSFLTTSQVDSLRKVVHKYKKLTTTSVILKDLSDLLSIPFSDKASIKKSKLYDEEDSAFNMFSTKQKQIEESVKHNVNKSDEVPVEAKDYFSVNEIGQTTMGNYSQMLTSDEKLVKRKMTKDQFASYLKEYNPIKEFANVFINNIVQTAEYEVNQKFFSFSFVPLMESESFYSSVYGLTLTPQEGRNIVKDIIQCWTIKNNWKFCINFLGEKSDSCSFFYIYEVKWSKPTPSYPVPQVTASVFFTVELSRIKPSMFSPKITFVFETEHYVFTPNDKIQHELFLENILDCKLKFFKTIRF